MEIRGPSFKSLAGGCPSEGGRRTILVIDGQWARLKRMGEQLGRHGYLSVLCDDGIEALELISGRGFDLVLIDMTAQQVNPFQILAEIRGSRDTADLPVIMITDGGDPAAAVEALAAGADDHVVQPMAFDILAARIDRTMARAARLAELKRSNLALDARVAARAIELGEARSELASTRADRQRLAASVRLMAMRLGDFSSGTSVSG